jgi:threonine/homoserine/homoserine lactone efflux protein
MQSMPDFAVFVLASLVLAITPGPGLFYVAARTLVGGRAEGIASSLGTALGGLVHVLAGALGVSAIVLASAGIFALMKLVGAAYLIWLGLRTILAARRDHADQATGSMSATGARQAFREGIVVEAMNPKTAAFFLAFIPQFVDPAGAVALQFMMLGAISMALNTLADIVVALLASRMRYAAAGRAPLIGRLRQASGAAMILLGAGLAFAKRPA